MCARRNFVCASNPLAFSQLAEWWTTRVRQVKETRKKYLTHTANKNVNPVTNVVQHGDGEWRESVGLEKETDPKTKAN